MNQNLKPALVANVEKKVARPLIWIILALLVVGPLACAIAAHGQEIDVDQLALTTNLMAGTVVVPVAVLEKDEPFVTFSGGLETWNQYLGSTGGVFHDKPVLQGNVTFTLRNGLYFDVWGSWAEGSWLSTWGHEADFTIGYAPGEYFDAGLMYILVSDLSPSDVGGLYMELFTPSYEDRGWSIRGYLKVDYYWPLEGLDPLSGWNTHLGTEVGKSFGKWSSTSSLEVLYDTGAFGAGEGLVWIASTELSREVGKSTIGLGVKYSRGINLPAWDDRTGEFAVGVFTRF